MIEVTEQFIKNEYEKYQKLYGINLPDAKIVFHNTTEDGFYANVKFENNYIITINPIIKRMDILFIKSILFHEFTHIADREKCPFKNNETKLERYMKVYSEIHASEIKIRTLIKIGNNYTISTLNYCIYFNDFKLQLTKFLFLELKKINILPDQVNMLNNIECFIKYINEVIKAFYYIGYCNIFTDELNQKFVQTLESYIHDKRTLEFLLNANNLYRKDNIEDLVNSFEKLYYEYGTIMVRKQLKEYNVDLNSIDIYNYKELIMNIKK